MVDYKTKSLTYRRAIWLDEASTNDLEKFIRSAANKLKTAAERQFGSGEGRILSCAKLELLRAGGVFLHVTAMTPGEAASIIKTDAIDQRQDIAVETLSPPTNSEFMDGDVFLLIVGNHLCLCSNILRDSTLRHYLLKLLEKANVGSGAAAFDIKPVASKDIVKLINDSAISSITLNAAMYEASNKAAKQKSHTIGALGAVGKYLGAMVGRQNDVTNDSLSIALTIKLDRRSKTHTGLGEEKLHSWALDLAKSAVREFDDADFVIKLQDNRTITPNELKIVKAISLPTHGKSVNREEVRKVLVDFYNELCTNGTIED